MTSDHEWVAVKEISSSLSEAFLSTRDQMLNLTRDVIAGKAVLNHTDLLTFLSTG